MVKIAATGWRRLGRPGLFTAIVAAWVLALAVPPARAQPMEAPAAAAGAQDTGQAAAVEADESTLRLYNRRIVTFRATLLDDTPAERAALANAALEAALAQGGAGVVTRTAAGDAVRFELDGTTLFFIVAGDVPGPRPGAMLDTAARRVEDRLKTAVQEAREISNPRQLALGAAYALAASALTFIVIRGLFVLRRRTVARLDGWLDRLHREHSSRSVLNTYVGHTQSLARFATAALTWGLVLLVIDIWVTFVLRRFAYTRPWGDSSREWLLGVLGQFAHAALGAVPGLLTAALIFIIARMVTRANTLFMQRVERRELRLRWLDSDIAGPTRRLSNVVVWLFALAMAYPYLPGSDSEAFRGVAVLTGLMLSLGGSGVVGQAMSGLSLMYSRTLRVGEYVKIGDTEGTVTSIGMFVTRIHTGLDEEVSLPSTVVFSQAVRNFSRLVQDGQFVLQTAVTIGYATPWRQVHAMLLEAARRTPGVAQDPAPYVVQTALSDFYVEYRLCAHGNQSAPRRRAVAMNHLYSNIQDVFNENGVQIMSPHYLADPPQPQVVPREAWSPELVRTTQAAKDEPSA